MQILGVDFFRKRVGTRHAPAMLMALFLAAIMTLAGAQPASYSEAPQLAERVAAGDLPPVEERLPENPLVVEPYERIGQYGGTWRTALLGGGDQTLLARTIGYENLVRWTPDWAGTIPNIAESFEANESATAFTFHLRQGMKWSDGEPFTADDIMFWYEDVLMNQELTPAVPSWLISGDEPVTVEKLDDYTVVFSFSSPNGLFLQYLATDRFGPPITRHPRHYLEQFHRGYNPDGIDALVREAGLSDWATLFANRADFWSNSQLPRLTGWILTTAYGEGTTQVVAERNPYYFKIDPEGNQLPYLDRVVYDLVGDAEVLLLKALAGEIDMQDRHIGILRNRSLFVENMERGNYRFFDTIPGISVGTAIYLNFNHEDPVMRDIIHNKDFRIGLSHAINREEIIDLIYFGRGEPFQVAPRPEDPFYDEVFAKQYTDYDVELANEYLDRAGYSERDREGYRLRPDGQRITIAVEVTPSLRPEAVDILELIDMYWQEVGIDMQIRSQDRSLLWTRKNAAQHDAMVWTGDGGLRPILNPSRYFPQFNGSHHAVRWAEWYINPDSGFAEEPLADVKRQMELYDQVSATADPDRQVMLMNELLEIAKDQFFLIGISLEAPGYGIVKNDFHNVPETMFDDVLYNNPAATNPEQYFKGP